MQKSSKSYNSTKSYPYAVAVDGVFGDYTIKATQRYLKSLNYYSADIDGSFGPGSSKALQQFLSDKGFNRPNRSRFPVRIHPSGAIRSFLKESA